MPKNKTKTLIITVFILDIISFGAFLFLFNHTKSKIVDIVNKEDEIKTQLKIDNVRVLMKDDLSLGKQYQTELKDYILPSNSIVDFIKTVEGLVASSGLKSDIKTVVSEPYDKGNSIGAEYLRVNVDVIGEWKNIQLFLNYLENYPLKINIRRMSLNKISDSFIKGRNVSEWSGSFEFTVVKMKDTK